MAPVAASLIASMAYSLIQTVASSSVKTITGKGVKRGGKEQEDWFLPLIALPSNDVPFKSSGKGVTKARRGCMDKSFLFCSIF